MSKIQNFPFDIIVLIKGGFNATRFKYLFLKNSYLL